MTQPRPWPYMTLLTVLLIPWASTSATSALVQRLEQQAVGAVEPAHGVLTNAVEAEPVLAWEGALK